MKKVVLILAAGFLLLASSSNLTANTVNDNISTELKDELKFNPIEIKKLPEAVSDAVKKEHADHTVEAAAIAETTEGKKVYKVKLKCPKGNMSVAAFKEDGSKFSL